MSSRKLGQGPTEPPSNPESRVDHFLDLQGAGQHVDDLQRVMSVDGFRSEGAPTPMRPILLQRERYDAVVEVGRRFVGLLDKVVRHRASDNRELARLVGFHHPPVSLWSDSKKQSSWPLAISRPDIGVEDGVPKVFEINVNSAIGGLTQVPRLEASFLRRPDLRKAWRESPVWSRNVASALARTLLDIGRVLELDPPRVGIVGFQHESDGGGREPAFIDLIDSLCMNGIPTVYVAVQDLRCERGKAYAGKARLDILLRMFVTADAPEAGIDLEPLRRIVAEDAAVLLSPESSDVLSNNRILAWMSEEARGDERGTKTSALRKDDRDFLRRHLPATFDMSSPCKWSENGQTARESLLQDQSKFVLKSNQGHSALGVTIGRECSPEDWARKVDHAFEFGDWVVQERIETDPLNLPVWSEDHNKVVRMDTRVVYGPLLLGDGCGGILMRQSPKKNGDIVSGTTSGISNAVFAYQNNG